ncbi:MAG: CDP-diacylglycerol--glycerol-3-phosphate 3-phosphatidyltransferase [Deltaproteobacteria bacterium]|nr:CDP-diacylglycerol--glycerol-3-phosphate 3-phosphatidyltransferase [Deltaproteobacteria bacterium]
MLNLPNFLTLIRIATIPLFLVLLFSRYYTWALIVFAFGGITDALDGPVARLTKQRTRLGAYLDPLADKLLIISSLVVLSHIGAAPAWFTILILSRDLIITLGYVTIYFWIQERMEIHPSIMGKSNTFLLLLTVTVILLSLYDPAIIPKSPLGMGSLRVTMLEFLILLTALTTVISGLQYVYRGLVWLQDRVPGPPRTS